MTAASPESAPHTSSVRTILFATDLTARCDRPLDRAIQLAQQWDAKLVLLHVLEAQSDTPENIAAAEERIRQDIEDTGIRFEIDIAEGRVAETVEAKAAEHDADLIVTGVARFNTFGDFVLGHEVDKLIRKTNIPVLIVKAKPRTPYQQLLVTTDFSKPSQNALETALDLFPALPIDLANAFHVPFEGFIKAEDALAEVRAEQNEYAQSFIKKIELDPENNERITLKLLDGTTCEAVCRHANSLKNSLTVVGTHGRGGIRAAMIGSVAEALLETLPGDVLMIRGAKARKKVKDTGGTRLSALA
ncbi:universal stress protein [Parasphingopyxis sp.]|uniref:universal stress protein n=1 Tax=Parasphingopyxis sp. TaxID=1920299 RepID=UPI002609B3FB|nr:universal stress protein [Parasphingopyxis sp.]